MLVSSRQFVGIDPGKAGGIVVIDGESRVLHSERLPWRGKGARAALDVQRIAEVLRGRLPSGDAILDGTWDPVVTLEEPATRPTESRVSARTVGIQLGALQATAAALGVGVVLVKPAEWSPWMVRGTGAKSHADRKALGVVRCLELWPSLQLPASRAAAEGIADAALLAEYGRQVHLGAVLLGKRSEVPA